MTSIVVSLTFSILISKDKSCIKYVIMSNDQSEVWVILNWFDVHPYRDSFWGGGKGQIGYWTISKVGYEKMKPYKLQIEIISMEYFSK